MSNIHTGLVKFMRKPHTMPNSIVNYEHCFTVKIATNRLNQSKLLITVTECKEFIHLYFLFSKNSIRDHFVLKITHYGLIILNDNKVIRTKKNIMDHFDDCFPDLTFSEYNLARFATTQ